MVPAALIKFIFNASSLYIFCLQSSLYAALHYQISLLELSEASGQGWKLVPSPTCL